MIYYESSLFYTLSYSPSSIAMTFYEKFAFGTRHILYFKNRDEYARYGWVSIHNADLLIIALIEILDILNS